MKDILSIIKYLLQGIAAYMELKRNAFYHDISKNHLDEKKQYRNEIEALRNKGTVAATDAADRLLLELQERERSWKCVSTAYLAAQQGNTGTDRNRPVPGP
jgi:hypothetical protein